MRGKRALTEPDGDFDVRGRGHQHRHHFVLPAVAQAARPGPPFLQSNTERQNQEAMKEQKSNAHTWPSTTQVDHAGSQNLHHHRT